MEFSDTNFGAVKNGVLVLSGFRIRVRVEAGALVVQDGIKGAEIERRFPRASCPVSRLIAVQPEGIITFAALRWLHNVGASFVQLDYDGTPIATSLPRGTVPAALRRTQALASIETRLGKAIAHSLIRAKIAAQIATLRSCDRDATAISAFANELQSRASMLELLGTEGNASAVYWQALANVPLQFGKRQSPDQVRGVPEHWRVFGSRTSSMTGAPRGAPVMLDVTGAPRGAVVPAQAVLNYLYGVLASEITIALHAAGLDPALGILHADKVGGTSLAYDLMEPARPLLDRWLLHWLQTATFSKRDFREDIYGFIRVTHPLTSHLAMTAALWRGIAEQLAEWIYRRLNGENAALRLIGVDWLSSEARRRAVRWRLGHTMQRPVPATCAECGKALPKGRRRFCSGDCMRAWHGEVLTTAGMLAISRLSPAARSDRSRRSALSRSPEARREAARTAARARWARRAVAVAGAVSDDET